MLGRDVIVIGGSAGSLTPLVELVQRLPEKLAAAVFVVVHIGANTDSTLPALLSRVGRLPASWARNFATAEHSHIYVAPPDHHLLLEADRMRLARGPKENHTRPALDPLFRSAALTHGARVVGVILSGYGDDGTAGLLAIKDRGGIAIVEDPVEALVSSMPKSALASVPIDHTASARDIAELLVHYDPPRVQAPVPVPLLMEFEHRLSAMQTLLADRRELESVAVPSPYTCPECAGVLYRLKDERLLRFRCSQAHAWSRLSLLAALAESRETALHRATRALREEAELSKEIAGRTPALAETSMLIADSRTLAQHVRDLQALLTANDAPPMSNGS